MCSINVSYYYRQEGRGIGFIEIMMSSVPGIPTLGCLWNTQVEIGYITVVQEIFGLEIYIFESHQLID